MRVLLIETEEGDAVEATRDLEGAGHSITRCHEPGSAPFPCAGMLEGGSCPVDDEPVAVTLLVRGEGPAGASAAEDGVRCALRRHLPLVIADAAGESPYAAWATSVHEDTDGIVEVVERVAAMALPAHSEAATRELRAVLASAGIEDPMAFVEVRRDGRDLRAILFTAVPLPTEVGERAAVRIQGVVREVDPWARTVDVSLGDAI